MKKYLLAAAVVMAAVVTAAPTAMGAPAAQLATSTSTSASASASTTTSANSTANSTTPATPIRTVQPGERVDAGGGWTIWLTEEGKFWSGPDGYENFRSVVDGNIDLSQPGVSHQSEGDANGAFHSGLYYGTHKAGRVELTDSTGKKTVAALLQLPGKPGWGVWYAHTGPAEGGPSVALYDRQGRLLAELPGWEF
ncbi:hypothetical protein [Streptomyces vilmorinianum]|uniref:hypothetical protein n=1 Tax=Streptomyces vilmorinianum TaxID=3051092 RepID=UPI0010FB76AE|nr:hypothetical protein [Streptomyces vilmorinianum]